MTEIEMKFRAIINLCCHHQNCCHILFYQAAETLAS